VKIVFSEIAGGLDRLSTTEELKDAVLFSNGVAECSLENLWEAVCEAEDRLTAPAEECEGLELLETLNKPAS